MSSFQTSLQTELNSAEPVSLATREYFRARLRNRLYDFIVRKYADKQRVGKTSQRDLAKRIRRRPEVINRLLAGPGNWTLDTVSDLLLGIGSEELDMSSSSVVNRPPRNEEGKSELMDYYDSQQGKPPQPEAGAMPLRHKGPKIMTLADYNARVESIGIATGGRFVRGNVTLKQGLVYTPDNAERERAEYLTGAGVEFKKN